MDLEKWIDIPNYEGHYKVSTFGNVKSLERPNFRGYNIQEKTLKTGVAHGYKYVILVKDGSRKIFRVHKLVAMVFLNHVPCKMKEVVNHIDHDKFNNYVDNLEVTTQRQNASQSHLKSSSKYVGVQKSGVNTFTAKIVVDGKQMYLGNFKNEYEAHLRYEEAKKKLKQI